MLEIVEEVNVSLGLHKASSVGHLGKIRLNLVVMFCETNLLTIVP